VAWILKQKPIKKLFSLGKLQYSTGLLRRKNLFNDVDRIEVEGSVENRRLLYNQSEVTVNVSSMIR